MITKTHERCGTCDWLGREAERTAAEHQRDHWTSTTVAGATTHTAHFTQEAPVSATPTRYRKKPVSIEAMRFAGPSDQLHALTCWMDEHGYPGLVGDALDPTSLRYRGEDDIWPDTGWWIDPGTGELMIRTLEGDMRVSLGDWVIRGVQGEFYPCKPSIFEATYDPADSDGDAGAILDADEAAAALTLWYDNTSWWPFIESEECDITGPGHQDGAAFAALVTAFDRYAGGVDESTEWEATDISHRWAVITESPDGEVRVDPTTPEHPHAIPITTLWGAR